METIILYGCNWMVKGMPTIGYKVTLLHNGCLKASWRVTYAFKSFKCIIWFGPNMAVADMET